MNDILSIKGIEKHLKNSENFKITLLNEITSTNALLKEQAEVMNEGTVIIADSQTGGRGRFTRKFHSPLGCGIYMSVLLKPALSAEKSVNLTAAAVTAVADAVENLSGKQTKIKWVNDLFIENKKVCGILTEGSINVSNGGLNWAIVGIGINVYQPENGFDKEISDIAGCVFDEKSIGLRNRLTAEFLNRFFDYYKELKTKSFYSGYKSRMMTVDKEINVIKGDEIKEAFCLDLDNNCRLFVKYPNGNTEYLSSGEVSIRQI